MQDIADAAGVAKATVSLALRDDPRIRPETRLRVQQAARELGYRTNAAMANLMSQLRASKTPKYQATLALLNACQHADAFTNVQTFAQWRRGCVQRAHELGYTIDDFWIHDPTIQPDRLLHILESRNIRGLIVAAILNHSDIASRFDKLWKNFASVAMGVRSLRPPLHASSNDQYSTAYHAMEKLLEYGYRRPGLVLSDQVDSFVEWRFSSGFVLGQRKLPSADRLPPHDFHAGKPDAFRRWLEKWQPDAILCLHTEVKEWLQKLGRRVPEDVALAHLDRTPNLEEWAGMDQNSELIGAAAIDMIVGQIHRNETGPPRFPKYLLIESAWVDGSTVRPGREAEAEGS